MALFRDPKVLDGQVCSLCSNGCPLANPMCGRGEDAARSILLAQARKNRPKEHEGQQCLGL